MPTQHDLLLVAGIVVGVIAYTKFVKQFADKVL